MAKETEMQNAAGQLKGFLQRKIKDITAWIQGGKGSMIIWKNPDETFYKELYLGAIEKM